MYRELRKVGDSAPLPGFASLSGVLVCEFGIEGIDGSGWLWFRSYPENRKGSGVGHEPTGRGSRSLLRMHCQTGRSTGSAPKTDADQPFEPLSQSGTHYRRMHLGALSGDEAGKNAVGS